MRSIVVLSGGMDSALCAAIAAHELKSLACLHVNYGQRTEARELKAFHDICDHFTVANRMVVDISHLRMIGGSSLTDARLEIRPADLQSTAIPNSYVPFRNANILAIATSWAETIEATEILIGAVEEDSSGYPDCRRQFFDAFEKTIALGTAMKHPPIIRTPVIAMSKADIVREGMRLALPFHLTWSCYRSEDEACGECDSCALRLRGFEQAGLRDPLPYRTRPLY